MMMKPKIQLLIYQGDLLLLLFILGVLTSAVSI